MNLLEKLDLLMANKGINRSELSKLSGVPYTTIDGLYKKGYDNAKRSTLLKLSDFFGISLDALCDDRIDLGDIGKSKTLPAEQGAQMLREALEKSGLIKAGEDLSPALFQALVEFANTNKNFIRLRVEEINKNEG